MCEQHRVQIEVLPRPSHRATQFPTVVSCLYDDAQTGASVQYSQSILRPPFHRPRPFRPFGLSGLFPQSAAYPAMKPQGRPSSHTQARHCVPFLPSLNGPSPPFVAREGIDSSPWLS